LRRRRDATRMLAAADAEVTRDRLGYRGMVLVVGVF
jgi:hypothetical protein